MYDLQTPATLIILNGVHFTDVPMFLKDRPMQPCIVVIYKYDFDACYTLNPKDLFAFLFLLLIFKPFYSLSIFLCTGSPESLRFATLFQMTCQEPSAKDISIMKSSIHEMPTKKATHKIHKLQGLGHLILSVLVVCGTLMYRYLKMGPFMELSCSLAGRNCPVQVSSQGYVDSMYLAVKDAFEKNFLLGHDIGAGVAAYVDNELVIDLQAGWQDKENHTPFSEDTLQVVFSSTKVLVRTRRCLYPTTVCKTRMIFLQPE